jgi:hypothetical protein
VFSFGRFGTCTMIIFLIEWNKILLYMLSYWLRIESAHGSSYNQRTSDRKWILGATGWNQSHGIYTTSLVDILILDWHIDV